MNCQTVAFALALLFMSSCSNTVSLQPDMNDDMTRLTGITPSTTEREEGEEAGSMRASLGSVETTCCEEGQRDHSSDEAFLLSGISP